MHALDDYNAANCNWTFHICDLMPRQNSTSIVVHFLFFFLVNKLIGIGIICLQMPRLLQLIYVAKKNSGDKWALNWQARLILMLSQCWSCLLANISWTHPDNNVDVCPSSSLLPAPIVRNSCLFSSFVSFVISRQFGFLFFHLFLFLRFRNSSNCVSIISILSLERRNANLPFSGDDCRLYWNKEAKRSSSKLKKHPSSARRFEYRRFLLYLLGFLLTYPGWISARVIQSFVVYSLTWSTQKNWHSGNKKTCNGAKFWIVGRYQSTRCRVER